MKRASIAILFLTATMPLFAAPGAFTLSGSAYCSNVNSGQPAVHLSWTTSANATQYDIYLSGQDEKIDTVPAGGSNTYETTYFAAAGMTRSYHLIAKDASTGTTTSNTVDVVIPSDVCPPGPFTVSGNAHCDNGSPIVNLHWGTSTQQPMFRVFRDGSQISGDLNWTNQDFTDVKALAGHSYTYTVTASNGSKTTTTPPLNITISSTICNSGPPPPGLFSASASAFCSNNAPAVHVNWTASSDAASYVVNRNGTPVSGTLPSSAVSFDDSGVTPGQNSYVIVASNSGGNASATAEVAVPAVSACAPPPITLTATTSCSVIASPPLPVVILNWSTSGTATGYLILRDGMQIGAVNANTTGFEDTGTTSGQTYLYVVRALSSGGGTDSNSVSVFVDPAVCQGSGLCEVSCAATVPAGVVGVPVLFALDQTPSCSNGSTINVTWTFGDATMANELAPHHIYASAGTYAWSVTISGSGVRSCTNAGTVTVTSPPVQQIPPKRRAARH